jgi:hypothetical protein
VEKEGDWFGYDLVNLVLRHSQSEEGDDCMYYEKSVEVDARLTLIPCNNSNRVIRLDKIKLDARTGLMIKIVHKTEH